MTSVSLWGCFCFLWPHSSSPYLLIGSGTSSTRKPLSTAVVITRGCAQSGACVSPSWTRRPAWPRTTATSGWKRPTAGRVPAGREGRNGAAAWQPRSYSLSHSRFGPRTDLHVPRPLLEEETETQHLGGPQTPALRVQDRWVELPGPGVAPT